MRRPGLGLFTLPGDPVNPVCLFMVPVIPQLMADISSDHDTTGNAYCQSQNVDKGIHLMVEQAPYRGSQIVFKHELFLFLF
jgi:hypothetical protein